MNKNLMIVGFAFLLVISGCSEYNFYHIFPHYCPVKVSRRACYNFIPRHRFEKSVEKLSGDRYCKHFTAWRQFLTCLYAQITGKDSLREIENGLLANHNRLYHLGMEVVSKSTLSEAMNRRDPEIFKALFEEILDRALKCAPRHKFRFHNPLYAIDSTTIDLCLNLYDL